jgi:threonine synthase
VTSTGSLLRSLECRSCCTQIDPHHLVGTCPTCGQALFAIYDLDRLDPARWRRSVAERPPSLWRYRELLPVQSLESIVTLGEGLSPILPLGDVPEAPGVRILLKDDGLLPTGSFKSRGMAVAVSRARELGVRAFFVPSAGNAGVALAAYGARAGARVRIYLPERTAMSVQESCRRFAAEVITVPGTIREAGLVGRQAEAGRGSFDMSTLREPYRAEGKKTMGFEIFEQFSETGLPDAILYPTGGGTGLIGMYRAFDQLRAVGLIDRLPRLYAIQPEGCAPVVRALQEQSPSVKPWESPHTIAPGLLVPAPFASERILESVRESRGGGEVVTDSMLLDAMEHLAGRHGISASPEGAAPYAALESMVRKGLVRAGESALLYNTGTGIAFSLGELRTALTTTDA